jgi:hypothetical protein
MLFSQSKLSTTALPRTTIVGSSDGSIIAAVVMVTVMFILCFIN